MLNSPAIQQEAAVGSEMQADAPEPGAKAAAPTRKKKSKPRDEGQIGQALKSVYQRTVNEDIPLEMLDLLKKLD